MDKGKKTIDMQAVLIAENFKSDFKQVQAKGPSCLMPCVNVPLLGYTIEFLIWNDIKRLVIFTCDYAKEVSKFVDEFKAESLSIKVIKTSEVPTVTSVIKDLDAKDLLTEDFLLINSHVVTNINIHEAIKAHNKRKSKDVPMLMTKLFIRCPLESKLRCRQDMLSLVSNNNDNQILKYESMVDKKRVKINEFFEFKRSKHSSLNVRLDLLDCEVDIVNQNILSVLEEFSNFEEFKDEFINHITSSEIIVDKIFMHEVTGVGYFSKITNAQIYFQTCTDTIHNENRLLKSNSLVEYQNLLLEQTDNINYKGLNEKIGSF